MRYPFLVLLVCALGFAIANAQNSGTWRSLPSEPLVVDGTSGSGTPSLEVDQVGFPVIAWSVITPKSRLVFVQRWDGNGWRLIGRALNLDPTREASEPSLALDKTGNPVVTWAEHIANGADNVFVSRWSGERWVMLGEAVNVDATEASGSASLVTGTDGNPVVAWAERGAHGWDVFVKRWDGTQWKMINRGVKTTELGRSVFDPKLKVAADGQLFLAVRSRSSFGDSIFVLRQEADQWTILGSEPLNSKEATGVSYPALGLLGKRSLVACWSETVDKGNFVSCKKWTGKVWQRLGRDHVDSNAQLLIRDVTVESNAKGEIFVAWQAHISENPTTSNAYAARWNDLGQWENLGAQIVDQSIDGGMFGPDMALDFRGDIWVSGSASGPNLFSTALFVRHFFPGR
jgi:hypothetical protein